MSCSPQRPTAARATTTGFPAAVFPYQRSSFESVNLACAIIKYDYASFPNCSHLKTLKTIENAKIDILDRLPTPFGLVRSGVAPDHPETKTLAGVHSAREFISWYNGHPDYSNMKGDLKRSDTAIILGQGNVALDVARILLSPTNELESTDIADHALSALKESAVRKVYLVGRRGPVQAACTAKELREILNTKDLYIHIQEADLIKSPLDEAELKASRIRKRIYDILSKAAMSCHAGPSMGQKELHFTFFRKPDRFLPSGDGSRVSAVRFEKTSLKGDDSGKQLALGTGQFEDINCGIAFKSIGYKSLPMEGLPFNDNKGIIPNIRGRVLSSDSGSSTAENGLYVVGWLKRGPTGIIGTNLYCAEETVASIAEDLEKGILTTVPGSEKAGRQGLVELLQQKNVRFVPYSGWEKIDAKEKAEGSLRNKQRVKLSTWEELLRTADV